MLFRRIKLQSGLVPENIKEEIKSRCDIVDIISEYVSLKQRGKNFVGLCPFHDDTKPSLYVSRDLQIFKCFACDSAGDVFAFLMKYQKITYPEALKALAERCGITLPSTYDSKESKISEELKNLNKFAVQYYQKMLFDNSLGNQALTYLKKRGIDDNIIASFKLGYSLPNWDSFLNAGKKAGFSEKILLTGGFILEGKKQGNYYDRFRGRIMFPIFDVKGEPIAFGGRIIEAGESDAKYINSPETPLYTKSKNLYNLNMAQRAIQKEGFALLVEGYMDAISCFQAGFTNVVASLGTSLTDSHVKLIKRYTDEVIIAYDSDKAGAEASARGMNLLIKADVRVRMLTIPSEKDPDDFIRENGADAFRKLISSAVDLVEYKIDRINKQIGIDTAEGKKKAVDDLVSTLASMGNLVQRSEYVKKSAERLNIEEEYIWQQLSKIGAGKNIAKSTQPTIKTSSKQTARERIERLLIECLIQCPKLVSKTKHLKKEDFTNSCHIELMELLWNNIDESKENIELGDLINNCSSKEARDLISNIIAKKLTLKKNLLSNIEDIEAELNGCIKKIEDFRKRESKLAILKENTADKITISQALMSIRKGK
ncbi:TPA: DNA primase [Candidatus Poribacteria bacterium]|nr:DNA primase [Candidatus Poribacteria bacterium]